MRAVKNQAGRDLRVELERVRVRLAESEATMKAIRIGEVDAIVVDGPQGSRIFTLQSPEEPYRVLAERMNEGAATLTTEGTILFCNQRLAEMVGVPAERLVGSSLIFLLREEERPGFSQLVRQALSNNVRTEGCLLRNDGTMFPVLLSLSSVPLQESGQGICLVATDLSDQKRAEEMAQETARIASLYTRSLIEASLDPLVTISREGTITDVNQATESVTGVARERLIGSDFCQYFTEPEAARRGYEEVLDRGLVRDYPLAIRHTSGQVRDVLYNAGVFRNEKGEIDGVFAAARDITDRKRAEEEVRNLNQELEGRVAARTAELLALNQELESFTYAVAHDLRAPLRHIHGFSDLLLLHDDASTLSAEGRHWLDCILTGTARMERLLEDLLDLSRFGRQTVNRRTIPLKRLVEEVIDDLAPETANRLIEWKLGDLPMADCDPALMRVVFVNLLSNAVKFTRPRTTATIEVGQKMLNGEPVLFVRDNGAGFDMKYAGKLFGVFQRLHLEKDFEGTGIGLATVQRILLKHGGRIWAEAEVDKGATFYFTFGGATAIDPQPVAAEAAV
jgi:PAS domain S-box-containing protein